MDLIDATLLHWAGLLWSWTVHSYGTFPLLILVNAYQLCVLVWLCLEHLRDWWRHRRRDVSRDRVEMSRRKTAAAWKRHAPYVKGFSLLGPAFGLGGSTLLAAFGIMTMGKGLEGDAGRAVSMAVGSFMSEEGWSYVLLVIATLPLVTGVASFMIASPLLKRGQTRNTRSQQLLDAVMATADTSREQVELLRGLARSVEALATAQAGILETLERLEAPLAAPAATAAPIAEAVDEVPRNGGGGGPRIYPGWRKDT